MCVAGIAWQASKKTPLLILFNRDECYNRPTQHIHAWQTTPTIYAAKDLVKGGTWLGINTVGRWAIVTRFRDGNPLDANKESLGLLTKDFLLQSVTPADYLKQIQKKATQYNPFNLIVGTPHDAMAIHSAEGIIHTLTPGIHTLSNGRLNDHWPKMQRLHHLTKTYLHQRDTTGTSPIEETFTTLHDGTPAQRSELPNTGVGPALELAYSPVFLTLDGYGTRSSQILQLDQSGLFTLHEQAYDRGDCIFTQTLSAHCEKALYA